MANSQRRSKISKLGFAPSTDEAWDSLEAKLPDVVFIAPAHDTVPSPAGNAIYVLVEQLCARLPYSCAILARWPSTGQPAPCALSQRILYYRGTMRPTLLERHLPYRMKMFIWGHELLHQVNYAKKAGQVARQLGAKLVVVEDTPAFCLAVRSSVGPENSILLHQHCDKPRVLYTPTWRRITRAVDGIMFVAEQGRQITQQKHGRLPVPSFVLYSGVDLGHYSPPRWVDEAGQIRTNLGIEPDSKVLLFLGRLVADKGVAEAAEAFNLARLPGSHMIIVGSFDPIICRAEAYLNRLRKAASDSSGRIHVVGTVPQAEVPAYYQASDLVIVPSIGGEGLPKIIFEALAMGRPVIASDRGGIWELLDAKRNAWLLNDPRNPSAIADTLRVAFQDSAKLTKMTEEILAVDRPRMSEEKMIAAFAKTVASFLAE
jgi:glycosyltransferase involved in cell wall biosynthesis